MDKYNHNSIYERAYVYDDSTGNTYYGETMFLAVLLKASGTRSDESEESLAKIMNDQNIDD